MDGYTDSPPLSDIDDSTLEGRAKRETFNGKLLNCGSRLPPRMSAPSWKLQGRDSRFSSTTSFDQNSGEEPCIVTARE